MPLRPRFPFFSIVAFVFSCKTYFETMVGPILGLMYKHSSHWVHILLLSLSIFSTCGSCMSIVICVYALYLSQKLGYIYTFTISQYLRSLWTLLGRT